MIGQFYVRLVLLLSLCVKLDLSCLSKKSDSVLTSVLTEIRYLTLPYIKGVTEPLTRVLKKHDITVVNKPLITLQQQFPAPKFRPSLESQTNVVYKIPCGDCSWCYIGETGRAFNTRKKEHLRNVKTAAKGSRIANHVWANSHAIDFDNASIIDKGGFRTRKILEAWHSKLTPNADNNSCPLPGQYNILFNKHS